MGRKAKVNGKGRLYRRKDSRTGKLLADWWMDYSIKGKRFRKSTGTDRLEAVREVLARTLADETINEHNPLRAFEDNTWSEMVTSYLEHLRTKGSKDCGEDPNGNCAVTIRTLEKTFGFMRLVKIGRAKIEEYKAQRLQDGVKKITVNRELQRLSAMLNHAVKAGLLRAD